MRGDMQKYSIYAYLALLRLQELTFQQFRWVSHAVEGTCIVGPTLAVLCSQLKVDIARLHFDFSADGVIQTCVSVQAPCGCARATEDDRVPQVLV